MRAAASSAGVRAGCRARTRYISFIERRGRIFPTDVQFASEAHLRRILDKIVAQVGRRVDESSAMVDARLPDGSRVNAIIPPLSLNGPAMTIRKFARVPFTINDLIEFGTLNRRTAAFLEACVRGRMNIIVAGGTGSGKTTLLNVLSGYCGREERIVTIEDSAELQLPQEHVVSLETRPANIEGRGSYTIRDLVRNALRMRPDRIVVGEVRGPDDEGLGVPAARDLRDLVFGAGARDQQHALLRFGQEHLVRRHVELAHRDFVEIEQQPQAGARKP